MIIKIVISLAVHALVFWLEVPHLVRNRLRREWLVVLGLTALNAAMTAILALRLPVPGPGRWLEALLGPIGKLLSG